MYLNGEQGSAPLSVCLWRFFAHFSTLVEYIELFLTIFFHCNLIGLITLFYIQNVLRPLLPCYSPAFSGIPRYPWVQRTNKVPYNLRERYSLNLTLTFNKNADGNC